MGLAISTLTFENVFDPEQPPKTYSTVTAVTWFDDTVKVTGLPWDDIPLHWPS